MPVSHEGRIRQRPGFRLAACLIAVLLVTAACGADMGSAGPSEAPSESAEDELTTVRGLLPAPRVVDFFPMLIAENLGYYREEGIDIMWEGTDGSSFVIQQLIAGGADVGAALAEPTLLGAAQNPGSIVSFYDAYSNTRGHIYDTWTLEDSGVDTLADLDGKTIGVKDLTGGEIPGLRVALSKAGLEEGVDVELEPVGESPAVQAEALLSGRIDALTVIVFDLTPLTDALEDEGAELVCVTCDPDNVLTSMTVSANASFAEANPHLIEGIGRAIAKATAFAQANPDAALAVMAEINPEEQVDPDLARRVMDAAIITWEPEPEPANRDNFGMQNMDAWQNVQDILLAPGTTSGLEEPIDLDTFVDTSFVSAFNDFDRAPIQEQAENYE